VSFQPRIAFDSNELTYMLDANSWPPQDGTCPPGETLAAWRVFFYLSGVYILPTVAEEVAPIRDEERCDSHVRRIRIHCEEILPEWLDNDAVDRRRDERLTWHPEGTRDCRLVAEAEQSRMSVRLTGDISLRR
jgi:hypothetical protein